MSLLLSTLQTDLSKEQSRDPHPDPERCRDLLHELLSQLSKVAATVDHNDSLEKQDSMALRKTLTACEKSFRLCKRRASNRTDDPYKMNTILVWHDLLALVARVTSTLDANKKVAAAAAAATVERRDEICHTTTTTKSGTTSGMTLPLSVSEYRTRLQRHQKELYKDPPVLPPIPVTFSKPCTKAPRRDATTKRLTFFATTTMADEEDPHPTTTGRKGQSESRVVPDFHPNQTPKEILQGGAFGGTYFRPIHSAVTNQSYSNSMSVLDSTVDSSWIAGLDCNRFLTSTSYDVSVNKFNAKCGGSLGMWESSGWISDADPYGWFQWYCRFYSGRRSSDDHRQIARWKGVAGPKGRFKSQLCNKILAAAQQKTTLAKAIHDTSISPVIRQTLFHWGLIITEQVVNDHAHSRRL